MGEKNYSKGCSTLLAILGKQGNDFLPTFASYLHALAGNLNIIICMYPREYGGVGEEALSKTLIFCVDCGFWS